MSSFSALIPLFFSLLFTGCGYRPGSGDLIRPYHTIAIPYIQGDTSGDFTSALIRQTTMTTPLRYVNCGADLLLQATLICPKEENIGFRYDIEKEECDAEDKKAHYPSHKNRGNKNTLGPKKSQQLAGRHQGRKKSRHGCEIETRAPWLIPTEERLWISAEITLTDNQTGCILIGPVLVSVFIEFDHEYYLSRRGVNVFSLGQVTDIREATDAAQTPLSEALAKKIVDTISYAW